MPTRRPVSSDEAQWFLEARKRGDVSRLIDALTHPELRALSVRCLGELHAERAIPRIVPLLDARSDVVRRAAARALGRMQAREAYEKLLQVSRTDSDPATRAWALFAAGCIGIQGERRIFDLAADPEDMVRRVAIGALIASTDGLASAEGRRLCAKESWRGRRAVDRVVKKMRQERAAFPADRRITAPADTSGVRPQTRPE